MPLRFKMFREVKKEETFPQIEERVLALWDKDESFKKSLDSRPETEPYTFYDGPPFATGLPCLPVPSRISFRVTGP